ncbi:WXG100 family type VII secretion target [Spirillospora sp. NPDC050679]
MTESKPQDHHIRYGSIAPASFEGGMDEMNRILDSLDPQTISGAGQAYTAASEKFSSAASALRTYASQLSAIWEGDDADAAIKQMGRLQSTATNLHRVANDTGGSLKTYGEQAEWYKTHRPGKGNFAGLSTGDAEVFAAGTMIAGPGGGMIAIGGKKLGEALGLLENEEDKLAREHIKRLSERTVQAHDRFPTTLVTDLPHSGNDLWKQPPNTPPGGMPPGGMPPGGMPPGGGVPPGGGQNVPKNPYGDTPPGGNPPDGFGNQNVPKNPYDTNPPGGNPPGGYPGGGNGGGQHVPPNPYGNGPGRSDLAGVNPPNVPPGGGGGAVPDPFGRQGLGGGGGLPPGGGGGGAALGGMPGAGLAGGPPGAGVGAGRGGLGTGRGGLGSGARGTGMGGMMGGGAPMGGRGGGQGEGENERSTWLVEDEDVWGGSDGDAAPPVIG